VVVVVVVVLVVVLWTGKYVKKNRAEDGGGGALDGKLCAEKQDRGWWQCQDGRVHEERTEIMMALGMG
jgi:hypothetical protein